MSEPDTRPRDPGVLATEPEMIERECGGFLAITPTLAPVRFAVVGATKGEAYANFVEARDAWAILQALP